MSCKAMLFAYRAFDVSAVLVKKFSVMMVHPRKATSQHSCDETEEGALPVLSSSVVDSANPCPLGIELLILARCLYST